MAYEIEFDAVPDNAEGEFHFGDFSRILHMGARISAKEMPNCYQITVSIDDDRLRMPVEDGIQEIVDELARLGWDDEHMIIRKV